MGMYTSHGSTGQATWTATYFRFGIEPKLEIARGFNTLGYMWWQVRLRVILVVVQLST